MIKPKLDFRTNVNVSLFGFIGNLSLWSPFCDRYERPYFERKYGLGDKDTSALHTYASIRKELDWEKECNLFNWAYNDYPATSAFHHIRPIIDHFANRKQIKNGITLRNDLASYDTLIKETAIKLDTDFHRLHIEDNISPWITMFQTPEISSLNCYPYPSVKAHSCQGDANGNCVSLQISRLTYKNSFHVLVHEYFHKALQPEVYFLSKTNKSLDMYDSMCLNPPYPGKAAFFFTEVIIHLLSDVFIFNENPSIEESIALKQNRAGTALIYQCIQQLLAKFKLHPESRLPSNFLESLEKFFNDFALEHSNKKCKI